MSSKIEQLIDEIEEYIDSCKFQPLSSTKIIVNKEEIDELLRELRMKTPEEIKLYQKVLKNREEILSEARSTADSLIKEATIQTNELINEHEIMQQAYAHANEVVKMATAQAQNILDTAATEANDMREAARNYTDQLLAGVEAIVSGAIETTNANYTTQVNSLSQYYETITSNRNELNPPPEAVLQEDIAMDGKTEDINLDMLK